MPRARSRLEHDLDASVLLLLERLVHQGRVAQRNTVRGEIHDPERVCRFLDDMTQDEIAAHLGLSRKTVGKRLDRIRAAVTALRGEEAS